MAIARIKEPVVLKLEELLSKKIYPTVEFTSNMQQLENQFEKGMLAKIVNISEKEHYSYVIEFSEKDFGKYNKELEKPVWKNKSTGEYDLRFSQRAERKETIAITFFYDDELECFLKVLEDNPYADLVKEYQELETDLTYQEWLQEEVLKLRALI